MLQAQNKTCIPVYQALNQSEKVINHSTRPDLVYASLTTMDLLLRQVKKDGIGIIFSHHYSAVDIAKKIGCREIMVTSYQDLRDSAMSISNNTRIIVVSTKPGVTIRISDLQCIAKAIKPSSQKLKWISILQQHGSNQLFKWELTYNN
jgi:citrate lyase alpha subunit